MDYAPPRLVGRIRPAAIVHASRTGARSTVQPTAKMKNAEQTANNRLVRRRATIILVGLPRQLDVTASGLAFPVSYREIVSTVGGVSPAAIS
jgi:hypothetical protein